MAADVPFAVDVAANDHDKAIIHLLLASSELGRPFIASRSVPTDRIEILRNAFAAMTKDQAFLDDAAKLQLPVSPKVGEEANKIVADIYGAPDEIVQAARKVMNQ